jgi:hypothetical protein
VCGKGYVLENTEKCQRVLMACENLVVGGNLTSIQLYAVAADTR